MTVRAVPTIEHLPVVLDGRKVGHVHTGHPGERDEWELHTEQDELLYLISGATDVVLRNDLDDASTEQIITLHRGQACIVPRGAWHRQVVHAPSWLLFLSPDSVHCPYVPTDGWESAATG